MTDTGRIAVIIEDDADIRGLLEEVLEQAGFSTRSAGNGLDGVELVRRHAPTVTTLDVSLPGIDGFETARRIRAISDTYLVMLTARSDEIDTLLGLEAGADDYLVKPFRPRELRARIEAMLRRPRTSTGQGPDAAAPSSATETGSIRIAEADEGWVEHRGLRLHPERHLVALKGNAVDLTRSEFELLELLMVSGGRVRSKTDLALALRGDATVSDYTSDADRRAVEVHMANLRRKLGEDAARPTWIETVRGVGYRLTTAPAD